MWHQLADPADPADFARVVHVARLAEPRAGDVRVIAIDGPSGSGKTSLANAVSRALDAPTAHMDQIFPGWDGLAAAVELVTTQVLEPLARGQQAAYRTWDWARDQWNGTITLPRSPFLVLEGCGSSVGCAGQYAAVRVWVDAEPAIRKARGLARDGETFAPHWQRWAAQEKALYAADGTAAKADLVIDTTPTDGASGHRSGSS